LRTLVAAEAAPKVAGMTGESLTLRTYPFDTVRIGCDVCGREGRYRAAGLADRFGWDTPLPDVLRDVADCSRWGAGGDPCGARYIDLGSGSV
jgi:hypothetical protein